MEEQERRLLALSSEIRSKERTLELLTTRFPVNSESLQVQLQERDQQIEEITEKLRGISAQLAVAGIESASAREKQIAMLQEDKIRLFRDLQTSEEQITALQIELKDREKTLEEEKENIELVEEALTEENAALKAEILRKDVQIKGNRGDISQLSKIVGEMSKLNTDLNEKILTLNGQMEKTNTAAYEDQTRARQTDDIEQAYNQLRNDYLTLQKREKRTVEELVRLQELSNTSLRCQERLKALEDALPPESRDLYLALQAVRHELTTQTTVKDANPDISTLKQQLHELTESHKFQTLELRKAQISLESALKRSVSFEAEKQRVREQYEESLTRLGLKGQVTADVYEKLREKVESLSQELTRTDAELQKSMVRVVTLQGFVDRMKGEKTANSRMEETKIKQIHDLKAQLLMLKGQKVTQETAMAARENRLRNTAAEMKELINEVWKKDTEILKLKKIITQSAQSTEENRSSAGIRVQAAAQFATNSDEIEKRDREIELFRGMLRSTQLQLKAKEAEVQRLKRKYENDPVREGKPVVVPARDLSPERLAVKLDSEIRKIEELAEIRRQVKAGVSVPLDTLRRVLLLEEWPRDKGKVEGLIATKLSEVYDTLAKWARLKFKAGLPLCLSEQATSPLLTSLLRAAVPLDVTLLLERLRELILSPSKHRKVA